jgi:hypothetical protein
MAKRSILPLLALAALLLSACATAGGTTSSGPAAVPAPGAPGYDSAAKGGIPNTQGTSPADGIPSLAAPNRDLILTANVSMRSNDPWATADTARSLAQGLGGSVLSLSQSGSGAQRNANLTVRVPSNRFDDFVAGLKKLDGEVLTSNVDAKDVTDQLVDLDARITALKAEEARYIQLFASAKTVDEMLKVQMALSQLRVQIEQLAAQQKTTQGRVDFSTVTLAVAPIANPIPTEPLAKWDPSRTFSTAATALAALFRVIADITIWLLVFGWIPIVALAIAFAASRSRRRMPAA